MIAPTRRVEAPLADKAPTVAPGPVPPGAPGRVATITAITMWAAAIAGAAMWALILRARGHDVHLYAAPLTGHVDVRPGLLAVPAVAVAAVAIRFAPLRARTLPWGRLLLVATVVAAAWAVSLAVVDGAAGLTDPVTNHNEYLHDVPLVGPPDEFLSTFTERIDRYAAHVRGHPPGMLLALWLLDRVGLGGAVWAAAVMLLGGLAAVPAVLVTVREVAGEGMARRVAPFVALAPAAVWVATSADGLFAGVSAWAVALLVLTTSRAGRTGRAGGHRGGDVVAMAGGVLFGAAVFLSYGAVLLGAIPLAVAVSRRSVRPILAAALGVGVVAGLFASSGFWWPVGLAATRIEVAESVGRFRPYGFSLLSNLAAFGLAVGPATAVGLAQLRHRRLWLLVGAALIAVAVADLSGLSKGEVERIWLPFAPWVILAGAAVGPGEGSHRAWLGANLATALAVQVVVATPW